MPMFSPEMGTLIANLGARRGARQEANADARARQMLLSQIQDPLYAEAAAQARADEEAATQAATGSAATPARAGGEFGFTPAPGATVTPMLTGLRPIIDDPGSASQSLMLSEGGVSGAGRNEAEKLLFPMLTKKENRDIRRSQAELDQLVRARPGLVSQMYGGEAGAAPIDARIKALQGELEKGQSANERLQNNQMLTGQRLVSSYSSRESQAAALAAKREMAAANEAGRMARSEGRLDFDQRKLLVNSNLKGLDALVRLYGINSAYLASPAALQRATMTGTLGQELIQKGVDANTIGRALGGIRRGTMLLQSNDPEDVKQGSQALMDANMDISYLLGMDPAPEASENLAKLNASLPDWAPKFENAFTQKQVDEIKAQMEAYRKEKNTPFAMLEPGEAPPDLVFSNGSWYRRESSSTKRPSKVDKPKTPETKKKIVW